MPKNAGGPPVVVAIDGPSGSGKSSTSRGVATRLGYAYLDTGAMYRAMTWALLQSGTDLDDVAAVALAAESVSIRSGTDPQDPTIHVDGVGVVQVDALAQQGPRHGAVHRTGVEVVQLEALGDAAGRARLAGARRAVDRDDQGCCHREFDSF